MGQQHNELRRGTLSNALSEAIGDTRGGGLERYSETLQPIMDLWHLPEWAVLRGERLLAHFVNSPAVAAEFSAAALLNPTGSRILAVLEAASVDGQAATSAAQIEYATAAQVATLGATIGGTRRDIRAGIHGSTCAVRSGSDPASAIGNPFEIRRRGAANSETIDFRALPVVLPPGFACVVILQTVNTAINVNFTWRERNAFPGELE